jgi:hypothetical protein
MYKRLRTYRTSASTSASTSVPDLFESRPFVAQTQAEQSSVQQQETAKGLGYNFANISISAPQQLVQNQTIQREELSDEETITRKPEAVSPQQQIQFRERVLRQVIGQPQPVIEPVQTVHSTEGIVQRGLWDDFSNAVVGGAKTVGNAVVDGAKAAGNAVVDGAKTVGNAVVDGAKTAGNAVVDGAKTAGNAVVDGIGSAAGAIANSQDNRSDEEKKLDATQYRVTKGKIQLVTVKEREDGKPHYVATHTVNVSEDNNLILTPEFEDLKDWYPKVTHINGMNVKINEGIKSAQELQKVLGQELGGEPDVLYTYSSTRGFLADVAECVAGKMGVEDEATQRQEDIMLDAVHNQHRTTVSAHSRGTIKTDNAVRNVHRQLSTEYLNQAMDSPEAQQAAEEAEAASLKNNDTNLNPSFISEIARKAKAKEVAERLASEDMNKYIQLIYAGNAVEFPSTVLKGDLYVAPGNWYSLKNMDYISFTVGSNYNLGQKLKGTEHMKLHRLKPDELGNDEVGGHNFDKHYARAVGKNIAEDMKERER